MQQNIFNLVSIIVLVGGFAATIVGIIFVWLQVRQSVRTREVDICLQLANMSSTPELHKAINTIWESPEKNDFSEQQTNSAERVCIFFELVGAICAEKYMSTKLIEEFYGSLVTGSYHKLSSFIKRKRKKPFNKNFALNFEKLSNSLLTKSTVSPLIEYKNNK